MKWSIPWSDCWCASIGWRERRRWWPNPTPASFAVGMSGGGCREKRMNQLHWSRVSKMQFTTASVVKSVIQFEKRDLSVLYFFPLSQKFVLKLYQTSRIIYSSECCPRNNLKFQKKDREWEEKNLGDGSLEEEVGEGHSEGRRGRQRGDDQVRIVGRPVERKVDAQAVLLVGRHRRRRFCGAKKN